MDIHVRIAERHVYDLRTRRGRALGQRRPLVDGVGGNWPGHRGEREPRDTLDDRPIPITDVENPIELSATPGLGNQAATHKGNASHPPFPDTELVPAMWPVAAV